MKKGLNAWLCIGALLLITSCGKERDYRMAIPADAGIVVGMNLESIAEKADVKGEEEQAKIEAFLKENLDASMSDYVVSLVRNPEESGLDLSSSVYLYYAASSEEIGFIVKVGDEEKVQTLFEKLNGQEEGWVLESRKGVRTLSLDRQAAVAFDESALLLLVNAKTSTSLVEKSIALLTQTEEQSFLSKKELFKAFETQNGDMTGVVSYGSIMPSQLMPMVKNSFPENLDLSDINLLLSLRFEQGKVAMQGECFYTSEVAKEWAKKSEGIVMPQKGLFLPQGNPAFWMGLGLKGEKMFDMLMGYPQYAEQMKPMEPVLRRLFAAIEGDVAISMPVMLSGEMKLNLNIELKEGQENDFMTAVSNLLQGLGVPVSVTGNQTYSMALPGVNLTFGLDEEKHFYLTAQNAELPVADVAAGDWTKEVKGNLLYYRFDIKEFSNLLAPFMEGQKNIQYMSLLDYICGKTKTPDSVDLEVVMKNQDENVLKQMVDIVKSLDE